MEIHPELSDLRRETIQAMAAVEAAQAVAARGFSLDAIESKGERDLVTPADIEAEDTIRRLLAEAPGFPVVGEERGGEAPADGSPHWLVDPICGTTNFAAGTPLYCTNLALVEGGVVTLSVVGDPSRGEICVAERGRGAWAFKAGVRTPLRTSLRSQVVVIEEVKATDSRRERMTQMVLAVLGANRWDYRCLSTTLGLAYLAGGRLCAYVAPRAGDVHAAAGVLLAQEAGATITDIDGGPWTVDSDSIFAAATPELHTELMALTRGAG